MENESGGTKALVIRVPYKTHTAFKELCIDDGISMTQMVLDLIIGFMEDLRKKTQ